MASFMNESSTTGFDAQSYTTGMAQSRATTRTSSGLSEGSRGFLGIGAKPGNIATSSYSVVGINTKEIPQMRAAIRNYVDAIQEHLSGIKISTDPSIALKGTGMEVAVKEYIGKVVNYCNSLCSNLLAFSDKLAKVQEAWENSDTNMSQKVTGGTSDLEASSSTYQEQF